MNDRTSDNVTEAGADVREEAERGARRVGAALARAGQGAGIVLQRLRQRPSLAVGLAGAAGLVLAEAVGVGEVAMGVVAAYAAYRLLFKGERAAPPPQSVGS